MNSRIKIGQIIKNKRLSRNLTMADVGSSIGYHLQMIYNIESGKSQCPLNKLNQICQLLDIDKNKIKRILVREFKDDLNKALI